MTTLTATAVPNLSCNIVVGFEQLVCFVQIGKIDSYPNKVSVFSSMSLLCFLVLTPFVNVFATLSTSIGPLVCIKRSGFATGLQRSESLACNP